MATQKIVSSADKEKKNDATMISLPAPEEPPIIATTKLGMIAKQRVKRLRIHGLNRKLRNPCITYWPAYVPVIVELCPEASSAIAKSLELQLPSTFFSRKEALLRSKSSQLLLSSATKFGELQTAPLTEITDMLIKNATLKANALSMR
eukprot:Gb_39423 [translate_table: standard]